ncbi:MAG: hypothetical protein AB7F35_06495 [Acetobacteraceae bacterium]
MPPRIEWSEKDDDLIRAMRRESASWDEIATRLGYARQTIIQRARILGVAEPAQKRGVR